VRNRLKVPASVTNAKAFLEVQKEFGSFNKYSWSFIVGKTLKNKWKSMDQVPATTKEFDAMSKDLKKTRIQIYRLNHLLRLYAGNRHGERPQTDCFRYKATP